MVLTKYMVKLQKHNIDAQKGAQEKNIFKAQKFLKCVCVCVWIIKKNKERIKIACQCNAAVFAMLVLFLSLP